LLLYFVGAYAWTWAFNLVKIWRSATSFPYQYPSSSGVVAAAHA